ncbi:TetR/AcrR family transcriptional regulator [Antrihabitans cavernicola]|uniref:TetR family transcriptional regulator n=1 Tax=Antrihabitans cavernicola TaxID=2495913 RepID=A0A5A7S7I1_9NOCA|nr:TetR/AcrR family transcriptional regulator [Spelaeibacter cavernicola]KAA0018508.1 TetR family transcriptional regulator [Spelaeibacter cavernicola]
MTKSKLSRGAIVDTAIELADEEGLDALSMRSIGERMGVGAMSLYRHIANKDELIALMTDEVSGRNTYPSVDGQGWTWRDRVRIAAEIDWALYRQHPWVLLTFSMPRYGFGPASLSCLSWLVEGFAELNVSTREATAMAFTVWNHIAGATLPQISGALFAGDKSDPHGENGLQAILRGTSQFPVPPALAELDGAGAGGLTPEELLYSGLSALCDGFAARGAVSTP